MVRVNSWRLKTFVGCWVWTQYMLFKWMSHPYEWVSHKYIANSKWLSFSWYYGSSKQSHLVFVLMMHVYIYMYCVLDRTGNIFFSILDVFEKLSSPRCPFKKTRQIWGIWKLRPAYSPETPNLGQNGWCFVPCDLEIWWMTLENNRASLLCCFKLCATFHSHRWIQTGVTVRKRPIWVEFDDF